MVVSGDFKIGLVEANSKIPFKEHTKDNETYVEVEPEAEYFVSFQRVDIKSFDFPIRATFNIDGRSLGVVWFTRTTKGKEPLYLGLLKYENGKQFEKALKFVRPKFLNESSTAETNPMIGKVTALIFEMKNIKKKNSDFIEPDKNPEMEAKKVSGLRNLSKAKVVRSTVGKTELPSECAETTGTKGDLLQTINLNYCTVPGLMEVGILPKPKDIFENYKTLNPKKRLPEIPDHLKIQPQRKKISKTTYENDNGDTVTEESYRIIYDLTHLQSDDDVSNGESDSLKRNIVTPHK